MKNLIPLLFVVLVSCKTTKTTTTTETITTTIDTAIAIPPEIVENTIPILEIIEPTPVINTERVRVVLQYDTVTERIRMESFVKPDTVVVYQTKTVDRVVTETIKTPASFSRLRWFMFGFASLAALGIGWKVLRSKITISV